MKRPCPDWNGSGSSSSFEYKVSDVYDKQLMSICFTNVPLLKSIPKREAASFARCWAKLFDAALSKEDASLWFDAFRFPKCILLAPVRGGRRLTRTKSVADLVGERLLKWQTTPEARAELWNEVFSRSQSSSRVSSPTPKLEKSVLNALRQGDVRKALQLFVAAPIAPKCDATFSALKALHPIGMNHVTPPAPDEPVHEPASFRSERVIEALNSFAPTSAAGLLAIALICCSNALVQSRFTLRTLSLALSMCWLVVAHLYFCSPFSLEVYRSLCKRMPLLFALCAVVTLCAGWLPSVFVWEAKIRSRRHLKTRILVLAAQVEWR